VDAIIRATARKIGHAAAGDHGFGRCAALIDAGAADVNFLNQRGVQPGSCQRLAKGSAALAGANDNSVVMLRGGIRSDPETVG